MQSSTQRASQQSPRNHRSPRSKWLDLAWKFPDERDCLASFLALEAAEVLAGIKPANLVQLRNRRQPCGRNLHELWRFHSDDLLAHSPLKALTLRQKESGDLMLFYSPEILQSHLQHPQTAEFLKLRGYPTPENLQKTLAELQERFEVQDEMPHEIGLFLGYPLKDVAGFMGCSDMPCTACRMWRIYGDPEPSLALSDCYADCRRGMAAQLSEMRDPVALLHRSRTVDKKACNN
ncbi:MAG: DUF3793 family protein [Syntrophotaleaceae bacterium]